MSAGQWYWCLTHRRVEPWDACRNEVRLGPYGSADDAAHALERVRDRNEQWDTDPAWNDPGDDNDS